MLQKISLRVFLSLATLGIAACSDDYTPKPNVTGKTIYLEACARCHTGKPEAPDMYWTINLKNVNNTYIAHKVNTGSLTMPRFPNIKGADMRKLREFVLTHSLRK
ncbi:MAG: cytochrome c551 [Methyloprofundus sp.]|nr:MAG: cytochrome c551 [Methyloprofundus sp.]